MNTISHDQLSQMYSDGRYHDLIAVIRSNDISPQSDPLAAHLFAAALFSVGEFAEAAPVLDNLEPSFGLNPDFLSLHAANCRRLGLLQRAQELFSRALELNPDSREIRNNYSNLLIDLEQFDQAREILTKLVEEAPDYTDARANLNRLRFQDHSNPVPLDGVTESSSSVQGWSLADPLLMAFSEEEVLRSGLRKSSKTASGASSLLQDLPDANTRAMALEQLEQANRAVQDKQFAFSLQLCSQVLKQLGAHPPVYDCASDAYLNLKRFHEAELCLLHALVLDGPTPKRCLNLVSFTSMRGDTTLALHFLRQAAALDPSHPQLNSIRQMLDKRTQSMASHPFSFKLSWDNSPVTHKK